jgi:glycosyltransferase involved in cell wall biosynthesis
MRLIVTHPDDPALPTTWSRIPMNLLQALRAEGHEVHSVACGRATAFERQSLRLLQRIRGSDITYSPLFRWYARRRLASVVRRLRPDAVIHCASTAALPLGPSTERHYLYCDSTWHRYVTLMPSAVPPPARIIGQVDRMERAAYNRFDHLFAFSSATREDLVSHFGVKTGHISVIGTGCGNILPYDGPKDYASGTILYVAVRAPRQKGGELLLAAFRIAVSRNPRLRLIMEGGSIPPAMAAGIPNVELRGLSNPEELQQLFNSASLYAMPALFEPWGNVYIEALASRTPILGLNRHSLPDITGAGRYGFLVDEESPEAVARSMLDAISDPVRLDRMGREGQRHVLDHYTWPKVAANITARLETDAAR